MQDKKKEKQPSRAEMIIRKFFGGEVSADFVEIVQGWLASGDSEEEVTAALGEIFRDKVFFEDRPRQELVDALPALRRKAGYSAPATIKPNTGRTTPLRRRTMFKVAAVLVPLLVLGTTSLWIYRTRDRVDSPVAQQTVSVSAADREQVILLPDGSTVKLAAGGRLDYAENFTEDRAVTLDGEGYFTVEKAEGKPFKVTGEAMTVTVKGTEFLMRAVDAEQTARVTLTTGAVEVVAGEDKVSLTPGQRLTYNRQLGSIELAETGKGELLRLRGKSMKFSDETLADIFKTVEGYYGVMIDVKPGVNTRRAVIVTFDGSETLDDVMFILQQITANGFNYKIENDTVTITR